MRSVVKHNSSGYFHWGNVRFLVISRVHHGQSELALTESSVRDNAGVEILCGMLWTGKIKETRHEI